MKTQTYIVKIAMPDGDMISPTWLKDLIQSDCDVEDSGRQIVSVSEVIEPQGLDDARNCGKGIHKQEYTGCDMSWMDEWKYASKGLDEAAEFDELIDKESKRFPEVSFAKLSRIAKHFYDYGKKAGAKWMAEQGVTKEAVIGMATKDIEMNVSGRVLDELGLGPGDKVIVQIRKAK